MSLIELQRERGAILVQVALMMVVLLLFVGLAIDVGAIFGERRNMQNAADAGALAGAHAICFGGDPVVLATEYAVTRNEAETAVVEILDGFKVHVTASRPMQTRFALLIGLNTVNVSAEATAACGVATSGCGLWPVAMDQTLWEDNCDDVFYVWDDDKILDCSVYDCDLDDDGDDDIVGGGDRGWLDFSEVVDPHYYDPCSQPGCGTAELKCYIETDYAARINLPACIPGDSGVKAAAWQAAGTRAGTRVRIPLFSSIGCESGHTCPGGLTYYVTKFGCATVIDADTVNIINTVTGKKEKSKVIIMDIECADCASSCGGTGGEAPGEKDLKAVSLID